jgi:hypothetical protein
MAKGGAISLIQPSPVAAARARHRQALNLAAAAACVVAPATIAANAPSPLRLAAVLALLCLAPGAALLSVLQPEGARVELGLVVGVSLGVVTVGAQSMLWVGLWEPHAFAYALAGVCLLCFAATLPQLGIAGRLRAFRERLGRIGRFRSSRTAKKGRPAEEAPPSTDSPATEARLVAVGNESMDRDGSIARGKEPSVNGTGRSSFARRA